MKLAAYAVLLLALGLPAVPAMAAPGGHPVRQPVMVPAADPVLAAALLEMEEADQRIRELAIASPKDPVLLARMREIDARNEARLRQIIAQSGWPTAKQAGTRGAHAAWLLAQHGSAAFLKDCLPAMQAAADAGDLDRSSVALSIDRSLMDEGRKQIYGSQFQSGAGGTMEMYPVEDEAHLDERRAAVGLGPIAEYRALILQMYTPKDKP